MTFILGCVCKLSTDLFNAMLSISSKLIMHSVDFRLHF